MTGHASGRRHRVSRRHVQGAEVPPKGRRLGRAEEARTHLGRAVEVRGESGARSAILGECGLGKRRSLCLHSSEGGGESWEGQWGRWGRKRVGCACVSIARSEASTSVERPKSMAKGAFPFPRFGGAAAAVPPPPPPPPPPEPAGFPNFQCAGPAHLWPTCSSRWTRSRAAASVSATPVPSSCEHGGSRRGTVVGRRGKGCEEREGARDAGGGAQTHRLGAALCRLRLGNLRRTAAALSPATHRPSASATRATPARPAT